jgi:hypothetical protein
MAALGATLLVHVLIVGVWQAGRRLPRPQADGARVTVQWITLPEVRRRPQPVESERPAPPAQARKVAQPAATAPAEAGVPVPAAPETPAAPAEPAPAVEAADAKTILERARRDAGAIDRALRKESRPLIVLPRDSPQIRLRNSIEAAAEMAPNAWYEAPKITELVNNTGDGARRSRIITGNGTYCITDRSTHTSIDMIEKHGKQMKTTCPTHETPANPQEWRTARDP